MAYHLNSENKWAPTIWLKSFSFCSLVIWCALQCVHCVFRGWRECQQHQIGNYFLNHLKFFYSTFRPRLYLLCGIHSVGECGKSASWLTTSNHQMWTENPKESVVKNDRRSRLKRVLRIENEIFRIFIWKSSGLENLGNFFVENELIQHQQQATKDYSCLAASGLFCNGS